MKKLLMYSIACLTVFSISSINYFASAQPNGLCKNIQKCNNENFSATENDDYRAGEFYNSFGDHSVNVLHAEYTGGDYYARAIFGKSQPSDGVGIGARFEAGFCAIEAFTNTGGNNFAPQLFGTFTGAIGGGPNTVSFGLVGVAGGFDSTVNIGVYGFTHNFDSVDGVTNYSGFFEGDVFVGGALIQPSDSKLKRNAQNLDNTLSKLKKLSAKSYEYKNDEYNFMNLPNGEQYGFIAQEVEEVFPHLVSKNILPATDERRTELPQHGEVRFKGINYVGMIPFMVEAINEQSGIIDEKEERIVELEGQVDQLNKRLQSIESKLGMDVQENMNLKTPSIQQNQPNPFNGSTTIEYYLPDNTSDAFLKIYNASGQEVQSYTLNESGIQNIDVKLKGVESGTLFYSLFVNGIAIDTKKMIVN